MYDVKKVKKFLRSKPFLSYLEKSTVEVENTILALVLKKRSIYFKFLGSEIYDKINMLWTQFYTNTEPPTPW